MGAIFHLRHYGQATGLDRHDYAQWVLPLQGELQFEMEGRGGRLDLLQGAFVAAGEAHDQMADGPNGFVIVDCPPGVLDDGTQEHLCRQRWLHLPQTMFARRFDLIAGLGARLKTPGEQIAAAGAALHLEAVHLKAAIRHVVERQDRALERISAGFTPKMVTGLIERQIHALDALGRLLRQ